AIRETDRPARLVLPTAVDRMSQEGRRRAGVVWYGVAAMRGVPDRHAFTLGCSRDRPCRGERPLPTGADQTTAHPVAFHTLRLLHAALERTDAPQLVSMVRVGLGEQHMLSQHRPPVPASIVGDRRHANRAVGGP